MKALPRYTLVIGSIAIATLAVSAPLLDAAGRLGLIMAAAVVFPLQVGLFALLVEARRDPSRFITFWGLGVLGRMAVVAAVGLSIDRVGTVDSTVAVMSTVGLFFIFLLLEPVFLLRDDQVNGYAR
jgi:hypothetical protein